MAWYSSLLAGVLPLLLLGFGTSALANRLELVVWGLGCAAVYAGLLRRGWRRPAPTAAALAALAGALGIFALLVARHQEALDLGFRALLPALYHPVLAGPVPALALAAIPAIAALVIVLTPRIRSA